jgi:ABC-2 type transport system permease protein
MREMLKYDFFYLRRTSKFIVFPLVIIVFSILSPLTARYLNELLDLLLGDTDIGLNFPDPTIYDSYLQFFSDLNEIVLFVILFTAVSIFIRDKTKGLMPLVLSKPINRNKYYLSKYISFSILILASLLVGYLVFSYYTYFLFDDVLFGVGLVIMLIYFIYILFLLSITLFTSVLFKSYVGSIATAFGIYIFVSILAVFDEVAVLKYFPGMMTTRAVEVVLDNYNAVDVWMTSIVTLVLTGGLIFYSLVLFKKQDLIT